MIRTFSTSIAPPPATGLRASATPRDRLREADLQRLFCFLWCGYFLLSPVYFFESGQPQIADYVMVAIFACLLFFGRCTAPAAANPILRAMVALIVYVVTVNIVWALAVGDATVVAFAFYYGFNLLGVFAFLWSLQWMGKRFAAVTAVSVLASIVLQVVLSRYHFGSHATRATVMFNNPNQLGYYLTLACSIFWIWSQSIKRSSWLLLASEIAAYACSAYLVTESLSRAAILSLSLLVAFRLLMRQRVAFILAAVLLVTFAPSLDELEDSIVTRFEKKSQDFRDEFYHRGYDRMLNHHHYLILGAGEGAYYRFQSEHWGELHSTFGTMLFCYGAVGSLLFARLFWIVGRQCGPRALLFLAPAAAFGMTHNGLRQWEFWMLFAFVAFLHSGTNAIRRQLPARSAGPRRLAAAPRPALAMERRR